MKTLSVLSAILAGGFLCLIFLTPASAQSCSSTVVYPSVVKKDVAIIKEVPVITKFVATIPLVEFPTYSAVYVPTPVPVPVAPAPAAPVTAAAPSEMKQILELLRGMDTRIRTLENRGATSAPVPVPAPKNPFEPGAALQAPRDALSVVTAKCASCHDSTTAGEKGGGFVMVESGALSKWTDRQSRKVLSLAYSGKMPPKSSGLSLDDNEVAVLAAYVDGLK